MKSRRISPMVAASVVLILAISPVAHGIGLVITGTVKDAAGVPIMGATVSDGSRLAYTDAAGRYTLTEPSHGTWYLSAKKASDYVPSPTTAVNTLTNVSDVDFTLKFIINPIVPTYVTSKPFNVALEATSIGPSSVAVTATIASTTVNLSYAGVSGSLNRWTGTYSLDGSAAEGSYSASFVGRISGTVVTNQPTTTFFVDVTHPLIDVESLSPQHHGNSVFAMVPLLAKVTDTGGSGIEPFNVAYEYAARLPDGATGPTSSIPSGQISYEAGSGIARTTPLSFAPGTNYQVTLRVSDRAGNAATTQWWFRQISSPHITEATARLSGSGKITGQAGLAPGTMKWIFDPAILVQRRDVRLAEGSAHAGWGVLTSKIDISSARIWTVVSGIETLRTDAIWPVGSVRPIHKQIGYTGLEYQARTLKAPATSVRLPQVSVDLPTDVTSARIAFSTPVQTTSEIGGICSDPTVGLAGCSTDLFRVFVDDKVASDIEKVSYETHVGPYTEEFGGVIPEPDNGPRPPPTPVDSQVAALFTIFRLLPNTLTPYDCTYWDHPIQTWQDDPHPCGELNKAWDVFIPNDVATVCPTPPDTASDAVCWINGVGYDTNIGLATPNSYADICASTIMCRYRAGPSSGGDATTESHSSDGDAHKWSCIDWRTGHDIGPDPRVCGQTDALVNLNPIKDPQFCWHDANGRAYCSIRYGAYNLGTYNSTQWGFDDGLPAAADELTMTPGAKYKEPGPGGDDVEYYRGARWIKHVLPPGNKPSPSYYHTSNGIDLFPEAYPPGSPSNDAIYALARCKTLRPTWLPPDYKVHYYEDNDAQGIISGQAGVRTGPNALRGPAQWFTRFCSEPDFPYKSYTYYARTTSADVRAYLEIADQDEGPYTRSDGYFIGKFIHLIHYYEFGLDFAPSCFWSWQCLVGGIGLAPERRERARIVAVNDFAAFSYRSNFPQDPNP